MKTKYPKQESWTIYYSNFSELERKAVEVLSKEVGKRVVRKQGVYTLYVLPCLQEKEDLKIEKNAIVVGLYDESALIRKFVSKSEIPENGYLVRVLDNPEDEDCSLALITAKETRNLYYGAVAFIDDYPTLCAPVHGGGLQLPTAAVYNFPKKFSMKNCNRLPCVPLPKRKRAVFFLGGIRSTIIGRSSKIWRGNGSINSSFGMISRRSTRKKSSITPIRSALNCCGGMRGGGLTVAATFAT